MATGFVKESALTAEVANQPLQATPGCAFLLFLAQPPDAPEKV